MSFLTPVHHYLDGLVHPSARRDALTAARHRAFIAPRLVGGFLAFAAFPLYLIVRGVPTALELAAFAWLMAPILIAYFLSRTGQFEAAQALSSLALAALATLVATATGGVGSPAAIWLALVPMEAGLSGSRRAVALASGFALIAVGAMHFIPSASMNTGGALPGFALVAAVLYAGALALGAQSLIRTGASLLDGEENRYRLLACNMTDVITRHGRHGAVLFASPAAEPLFGAGVRSLLGHGLFERVHVADRPAYLKALSDAAAGGAPQSAEFRVRRQSAAIASAAEPTFVWVEMRCRPFSNAEENDAQASSQVVAVMRDVSDRKQQQRAIEEARAEAEHANLAKGRFLATISHELRTPLNVIIGFSEMLTRAEQLGLDSARRHDYAELINESGQHLLAVVNGMLDMSKIESGNFAIMPEPFALGPAIATCCDLLTLKAAEAGIELVRRNAPDLPDIVADKRSVKQVLLNLLSNAIKFTNRGGKVTITSVRDGAMVAIMVEDTGVGIGADDLPRLGDPFFQARASYDRRHDGTGLGLSIVKGLVALHGGTFDIRSRLGVGTTVTVRLPIDCETTVRQSLASESAQVIELAAPAGAMAALRKIA